MTCTHTRSDHFVRVVGNKVITWRKCCTCDHIFDRKVSRAT